MKSPDGQYLAYLSRLERPLTVDTVGSGIIVVRSLDSGEERDLFPQLNFLGDTRLRWAPDGQSILISGEAVVLSVVGMEIMFMIGIMGKPVQPSRIWNQASIPLWLLTEIIVLLLTLSQLSMK